MCLVIFSVSPKLLLQASYVPWTQETSVQLCVQVDPHVAVFLYGTNHGHPEDQYFPDAGHKSKVTDAKTEFFDSWKKRLAMIG